MYKRQHHIYEDKFQNIWIGTNKGLVLITPKEKLFETFVTNNNGGYNSIRGIEEYDDEQLFVSGYLGLFFLNKNTKNTISHTKKIGLGSLTIVDTILVGDHDYSFWVIDKQKKSFKRCDFSYLSSESGNVETRLFYQDQFNQIWIITSEGLSLIHI